MKFSRALIVTTAFSSLVLSSAAFAQEEDDDGASERTFEQNLIHQLLTGLGATDGRTNSGIKYRERSPLVLPPQMNLPPPQSATRNAAPANWPKDPDALQRRELSSAKRESMEEASRPLKPSELAKGRIAPRAASSNPQPGVENSNRSLKPSELGYRGGLLGSLWGAGQTEETAKFTGEPDRTTLTEPPPGYQTPSPNFAYGVGQDYKKGKNQPLAGQDPARGGVAQQ